MTLKKAILFLLLNFMAGISCMNAQHDTPDSLKKEDHSYLKTIRDSSFHKRRTGIKPTTDFDQRFSFIRNQRVNIWGQRGGILINERLKTGLGVYFMNDTRLNLRRTRMNNLPGRYLQQRLLFGTAYIEPFLIRKQYWELSVPFELGFGQSSAKIYETDNDAYLGSNSRNFLPAGTGLSLSIKLPALPHFRPFSWVGINFLAGYRYTLLRSVFKTDYDGAFWSISGAIFLDRMTDDLRKWKRERKYRDPGLDR